MEKKWRRIGKGETIPTSSIIRPINGGLPNITGSRVMMGQDCYYLSVDDACELLKDLPLETETETKERNEATIIKKLIGLVKETELIGEENRTSLLDWLEKQGEKKPNPYSGTSFEYNGHTWGMCARDGGVEILIDGHIKGRVFTNDSNAKEMFIKALERVEEQNAKGYKLTDCDKNTWWEDFKAYVSCAIEQNPAWSEDDDNCLINAINVCEINDYNETAEWLKDLKERVQPQPKQEWSEEDEVKMREIISYLVKKKSRETDGYVIFLKYLKFRLLSPSIREFDKEEGNVIDHLIAICDDAMCYDTFAGCSKKDIEKYKTFLTNLKFGIDPQKKQWKPSDEQMKAIEFMVRSFGESGTLSPYGGTMAYATSLLIDLKKL